MKHCDRGMRSIVTIIAFLSKGINCFDMDIVMLPISTIKALFYSAVRQAGNGAHSWWCFDSISLKVWGHRSHSAIYSIDTASSQLWPDITLLYPNGSEYFQRCKETEAGREDGIEPGAGRWSVYILWGLVWAGEVHFYNWISRVSRLPVYLLGNREAKRFGLKCEPHVRSSFFPGVLVNICWFWISNAPRPRW